MTIPHPGILDPESFNKHFELHCYEPCDALKPFVVHIWTQRHRTEQAKELQPIELPSGPNVYIFINAKEAVIRGATSASFDYEPHSSPVAAGVKFRPGGFYPFWKKSMSELENNTLPITTVFSEANKNFANRLLKQSDAEIVRSVEELLLAEHPTYDKKIDTVDRILKIVEQNPLTQSSRDVARVFGRSERSVQLLFQHYVGIPLKWVIVRRRLLHTINQVMLFHSSWTSAAAEAGYSNQSHFTREFKQATGMSPTVYQKSLQKN